MKANIYIDGFNLYYGALRKTPYKWLNLLLLCQRLLPNRSIGKIRYFTARITPLPTISRPRTDSGIICGRSVRYLIWRYISAALHLTRKTGRPTRSGIPLQVRRPKWSEFCGLRKSVPM